MPYSWKGKDGTYYSVNTVTDRHLTFANRLTRERVANLSDQIEHLSRVNTYRAKINKDRLEDIRRFAITMAVETGREIKNRGLFKLPARVKFSKEVPLQQPLSNITGEENRSRNISERTPEALALYAPGVRITHHNTDKDSDEVVRLREEVARLKKIVESDNKNDNPTQSSRHRRIVIED